MTPRIPPVLCPGARIRFEGNGSGTLGPYALTSGGEIVLVVTRHQLEGSRGPLYLEPEMIPVAGKSSDGQIGFDYSLKMKDVFDALPIVLKNAISPNEGRSIFKVGMKTGFSWGRITNSSKKIEHYIPSKGKVKMVDVIETNLPSEPGDSGSYGLSLDTLEPVGLLSCGNITADPKQKKTCFSKLKNLQEEFKLQGFYAPLSFPDDASPELKLAISSFVPDGLFLQKSNIRDKSARLLMEQIGIKEVKRGDIGFNVQYEDMIVTTHPFLPGDAGSYLTNSKNRLAALTVAGNKDRTFAIKIQRVLEALELELIPKISKKAFSILLRSSFWRTRCENHTCNLIIPPSVDKCPFCGSIQKRDAG